MGVGGGSWDTHILSEPQNGRPAVTARCLDHKWTSHNNRCDFCSGLSVKFDLFWISFFTVLITDFHLKSSRKGQRELCFVDRK